MPQRPGPTASAPSVGPVLYVSVGLAVAIVVWGVAAADSLNAAGAAALDGITRSFGWAYLLVSLGFSRSWPAAGTAGCAWAATTSGRSSPGGAGSR